MNWRRGLGLALLLALSPYGGPAQSSAPAGTLPSAGPAHCRFMPPAGFPQTRLNWSGACAQRLAQGSGALRAYAQGRVVRSFFGTFEAGQPLLGVVEVPDEGFIAGRFESGQRVDDGERNTLIQAFEAAAQAARELAAVYRKAGNRGSARYYEAKAEQLASQLD
ncbi:MAG: hypothetical protein Q8K96_05895 [Rubrivivax sp.]|nr:hypothetical protein [Rubrivivax sp.]